MYKKMATLHEADPLCVPVVVAHAASEGNTRRACKRRRLARSQDPRWDVELSVDLWVSVLEHLSCNDIINLFSVSTAMFDVATCDALWRRIVMKLVNCRYPARIRQTIPGHKLQQCRGCYPEWYAIYRCVRTYICDYCAWPPPMGNCFLDGIDEVKHHPWLFNFGVRACMRHHRLLENERSHLSRWDMTRRSYGLSKEIVKLAIKKGVIRLLKREVVDFSRRDERPLRLSNMSVLWTYTTNKANMLDMRCIAAMCHLGSMRWIHYANVDSARKTMIRRCKSVFKKLVLSFEPDESRKHVRAPGTYEEVICIHMAAMQMLRYGTITPADADFIHYDMSAPVVDAVAAPMPVASGATRDEIATLARAVLGLVNSAELTATIAVIHERARNVVKECLLR